METALFYLFAGISLIAAISVITQKRVFYSALSLIVCLCALAGIYMLLQAQFIAAVQIIVYAGAIMVLFLFVIMLLDPFSNAVLRDKRKYLSYLSVLLGAAVIAMLFPLLRTYDLARTPRNALPAGTFGSVKDVGESLFNQYLLPFEVTSILILVAIIGAVILAKRQSS
jgi:NADH-quinone oxidoreductase subunit J